MSEPKEIETWAQDYLVCPYCGKAEDDLADLSERGGDFDCGYCGKTFHYEMNVEVTYSSFRIESTDKETSNG